MAAVADPSISPGPIPVLMMNEPGLLEVLSDLAVPSGSLLVAGLAVWLTIRAERRARRAEERASVVDQKDARRAYAEQLLHYTRTRRRDSVDPQSVKHLDDWNDLQHSAPDLQASTLLAWAVGEYNDLDDAFASTDEDPAIARMLLQNEIEGRVHLWVLSGFAKVKPPHFGRGTWPTANPKSFESS